ncbi:MAG: DUF3106 domain-containing protein [Candidatus Aenigmatarchaeota archaeon]
MDIEKKLKEMEESIKTIAEFVRDQTEKIEAELSMPDYSDEMEKIKETFSDEKEYARLQAKKIDKLEGHVEVLLKSPKDKSMEEKFKKSMQSTRAELDKLKHELMPKVKFIEGKMDKIKEAVEEVGELHELKGHMKELETKMQASVEGVEKQLKEVTNTNFGDNYKKELERLNEGMLARFKDNNVEYFEKLGYIEQRVNSLTGKVDKTSNDDILQKVKSLDEKLGNLKESLDGIAALNPEEMKDRVDFIDNKLNETLVNKNQLDDMEKTLRETRAVANRFKDFNAEEYREELVKEINGAIENFKRREFGNIKDIGESLSRFKNLELSDVRKINSLVEELKGLEIDDVKAMKNIETRDIRRLSTALDEMKGVELEDIGRLSRQLKDARESIRAEIGNKQATEERLASIESKMEELKRAEKKFDKHIGDILDQFKDMEAHNVKDMAKQLKEAKELLEDESVSRQSFEKRVFDIENKVQNFEKSTAKTLEQFKHFEGEEVKKLKQLAEHFEHLESDDIKKLKENMEHFSELESDDIKKLKEMVANFEHLKTEDIGKLKQMVEHFGSLESDDIKKLRGAMEQLKGLEAHDISSLTEKMKNATEALEDESVNRQSMEKRIMDLESKTEKIDSMEIHDIENLANEMKYAKETLEEESVTRQSLEKRLHAIETDMSQVRGVEAGQENAEKVDVTKLSNRIQDMESNMKLMTVRLLTQQLNEFAKSIDRRLPNIVSREEYLRQIADLNQRIRTVEAPDLAPLGARVGRLEKKLEEIAGMMRGMYNRIPIVVE